MFLGEIIKSYRDEHGLSMQDFASLSKLSKPYISQLEKTEIRRPETLSSHPRTHFKKSLLLWESHLMN